MLREDLCFEVSLQALCLAQIICTRRSSLFCVNSKCDWDVIVVPGVFPCWCVGSAGEHERCPAGQGTDCIPVSLPWLPHEETLPKVDRPEVRKPSKWCWLTKSWLDFSIIWSLKWDIPNTLKLANWRFIITVTNTCGIVCFLKQITAYSLELHLH